jgi:hypothetical protein
MATGIVIHKKKRLGLFLGVKPASSRSTKHLRNVLFKRNRSIGNEITHGDYKMITLDQHFKNLEEEDHEEKCSKCGYYCLIEFSYFHSNPGRYICEDCERGDND